MENRIRCNHCMTIFYEEQASLTEGGDGEMLELCPACGKGDALMDLEGTEDSRLDMWIEKATLAIVEKKKTEEALEALKKKNQALEESLNTAKRLLNEYRPELMAKTEALTLAEEQMSQCEKGLQGDEEFANALVAVRKALGR